MLADCCVPEGLNFINASEQGVTAALIKCSVRQDFRPESLL